MHAMIDGTIERVEQLYTTLTGQRPPHLNGNGAVIPPETDPLTHVEEQLARLVAAAEQLVPSPPTPTWVPRAVMWHAEHGVTIIVDVPGVARDQLQIRAEHCAITVTGVRTPPWKRGRPVLGVEACDAQLGTFARSFLLETPVAAEHVSATLGDGVLTVRIDNTKRGEPSQIQIKSL